MDGASRQDNLAACSDVSRLAAHIDVHATDMRAIALELQRVDDRLTDDREVGAPTRRLEIAVVGRDAQPLSAVDRVGSDAGASRCIVVFAPRIAETQRRLSQRPVDRAPLIDGRAIDWQGAAVAVIGRVAEIDVGFKLAEVGEAGLPAPARRAHGGPVLEILGNAADGDLPVDGRTAADRPSAPQQLRLLSLGAARQQLRVAVVVVADGAQRVRDAKVMRRLGGAEVAAGLEQQDAQRRVLGQPGRERRAGGPAADDDVVVLFVHVSHLVVPADGTLLG